MRDRRRPNGSGRKRDPVSSGLADSPGDVRSRRCTARRAHPMAPAGNPVSSAYACVFATGRPIVYHSVPLLSDSQPWTRWSFRSARKDSRARRRVRSTALRVPAAGLPRRTSCLSPVLSSPSTRLRGVGDRAHLRDHAPGVCPARSASITFRDDVAPDRAGRSGRCGQRGWGSAPCRGAPAHRPRVGGVASVASNKPGTRRGRRGAVGVVAAQASVLAHTQAHAEHAPRVGCPEPDRAGAGHA